MTTQNYILKTTCGQTSEKNKVVWWHFGYLHTLSTLSHAVSKSNLHQTKGLVWQKNRLLIALTCQKAVLRKTGTSTPLIQLIEPTWTWWSHIYLNLVPKHLCCYIHCKSGCVGVPNSKPTVQCSSAEWKALGCISKFDVCTLTTVPKISFDNKFVCSSTELDPKPVHFPVFWPSACRSFSGVHVHKAS